MPTTTTPTATDHNTERALECLRHLQCSVPDCKALATTLGEFTYCADHAHVWEIRYTDADGERAWTRVRATRQQDAMNEVRDRYERGSVRFEILSVLKVV